MKTNLEKLQNMLQLVRNNFKTLQPSPKQNEGYIVSIGVANYSDSLFIAADIIKLCILAIRAEESDISASNAVDSNINLSGILEIVLQLLPFEEMEILDELQLMLRETEEQNI